LGGKDMELVRCLGHIPQFEMGVEGLWKEIPST
jgi:hypothetical protein